MTKAQLLPLLWAKRSQGSVTLSLEAALFGVPRRCLLTAEALALGLDREVIMQGRLKGCRLRVGQTEGLSTASAAPWPPPYGPPPPFCASCRGCRQAWGFGFGPSLASPRGSSCLATEQEE